MSEIAKKLIVSAPGCCARPSPDDKQVCPVCQITFLEFLPIFTVATVAAARAGWAALMITRSSETS